MLFQHLHFYSMHSHKLVILSLCFSVKMNRQLSTALSDAILSYVSYAAAYKTMSTNTSATVGFVIIGTAAFIGTIRFGLQNPRTDIISFHKFLSWMGSAIAVPYIAAAYHKQESSNLLASVHIVSGFALVATQKFLSERQKRLCTEAVSSYAVISILTLSLVTSNNAGAFGAICYVIAGLIVGTDGHISIVPRVDIFHYVLVIATLSLMQGLRRGPEPVFFTPPVTQ